MKSKLFLYLLCTVVYACGLSQEAKHQPEESLEWAMFDQLYIGVKSPDVMASWYHQVLGAERVQKYADGRLELVMGDQAIYLKKESSTELDNHVGLFKVGYQVGQIAQFRDSLSAMGVTLQGELYFDENMGLSSFLAVDPEGNLIQFFGSEGAANPTWMFLAYRGHDGALRRQWFTEKLGCTLVAEVEPLGDGQSIYLLKRKDIWVECVVDHALAQDSSPMGYQAFSFHEKWSHEDFPRSESLRLVAASEE